MAACRRLARLLIAARTRILLSSSSTSFSLHCNRLGLQCTTSRVLKHETPFVYHNARRFTSAAELPVHQVLNMPALSPTMNQGNIVAWKKKEGDKVSAGDILAVVETDKSTTDFDSVDEGYLAKILVPAGSNNVTVGQPIAILAEDAEGLARFADYHVGEQKLKTAKEAPTKSDTTDKSWSRIGPSVRRLIAEAGLDPSSIQGTGPKGLLVKGDVLNAMRTFPEGASTSKEPTSIISTPSLASSAERTRSEAAGAAASYEDFPTSQIRKVIAKRLQESKSGIPHLYLNLDAVLDGVLSLRKMLKDKHGAGISVNDFVIKAAALALKAVPEANSQWDDNAGEVIRNKSVDISIAVATEKGLMTPIIKNADQKSLAAISTEVKSLADKAKNGKLKPEEYQGGTFSISNLGMYPVSQFAAIINPPQACILAVGKGEKVVVWEDDESKPKTITKMSLTLSADHRVFDGGVAGKFLEALSTNINEPRQLLL